MSGALALTHYQSVATLDCVSSKQSAAGLNGRFFARTLLRAGRDP